MNKTTFTLPELKAMMKHHNIKGTPFMKKGEIATLLLEKGIITLSDFKKPIIDAENKEKNEEKYAYLKGIRNSPKKVEVRDLKTGIITVYPSIYKACRALSLYSNHILVNNGKVFRGYEIKIV